MRTLPPSPTNFPDEGQVYQPEEDSFLLLQKALEEVRPDDIVLEVGTGSGYIASSIPACRMVIATDISPHAVLSSRAKGVQVIRTDLTAGLCRVFTLILFNPPYIPTLPHERLDDWLEYALDGGLDGRRALTRFLMQVPCILAPEGRVMVLVSSLQNFKICEKLFTASGFSFDITGKKILEDGEELRVYLLKIV